tara:strand:+ start:699 stop:878 length:180 start_codon:yes stop_codon:yes gene_type:complete
MKYIATFKFTEAWFTQHSFNKEIESDTLNLKQLKQTIENEIIDNDEPYRLIRLVEVKNG